MDERARSGSSRDIACAADGVGCRSSDEPALHGVVRRDFHEDGEGSRAGAAMAAGLGR